MLDFIDTYFSSAQYMQPDTSDPDLWRNYFIHIFSNSPITCEILDARSDEYGGDINDLAKEPCARREAAEGENRPSVLVELLGQHGGAMGVLLGLAAEIAAGPGANAQPDRGLHFQGSSCQPKRRKRGKRVKRAESAPQESPLAAVVGWLRWVSDGPPHRLHNHPKLPQQGNLKGAAVTGRVNRLAMPRPRPQPDGDLSSSL
jgi:hypothetical protein